MRSGKTSIFDTLDAREPTNIFRFCYNRLTLNVVPLRTSFVKQVVTRVYCKCKCFHSVTDFIIKFFVAGWESSRNFTWNYERNCEICVARCVREMSTATRFMNTLESYPILFFFIFFCSFFQAKGCKSRRAGIQIGTLLGTNNPRPHDSFVTRVIFGIREHCICLF